MICLRKISNFFDFFVKIDTDYLSSNAHFLDLCQKIKTLSWPVQWIIVSIHVEIVNGYLPGMAPWANPSFIRVNASFKMANRSIIAYFVLMQIAKRPLSLWLPLSAWDNLQNGPSVYNSLLCLNANCKVAYDFLYLLD